MNVTERTQAMEMLWDSLLKEEQEIDSPSWHTDILQERARKIEKGEAIFISLNELKESLRLMRLLMT